MQAARPPVAGIDIDGVLADPSHRLHFIEGRPRNWRGFFAGAHADPPLTHGISLVADLVARGITPVYVSGRPEYLRRTTVSWLRKHELPAEVVYLRGRGDFRPAPDLKLELYNRIAEEFDVVEIIDDDLRVVSRLRAAGFAVRHADWFRPEQAGAQALAEAQDDDGKS